MLPHIPKGGMCRVCERRRKDCSHLKFHTMPPIAKSKDCVVVRCNHFRRAQQGEGE